MYKHWEWKEDNLFHSSSSLHSFVNLLYFFIWFFWTVESARLCFETVTIALQLWGYVDAYKQYKPFKAVSVSYHN